MLSPEQLALHIPRHIQDWSPSDVRLWFSLHSINTTPSFDFNQQSFNGTAFLEVTPQYLYQQCGVTSVILLKKILEWIQEDAPQFEQLLHQSRAESSIFKKQLIVPEKLSVEVQMQLKRHSSTPLEEELHKESSKENTPLNRPIERGPHSLCALPLDNVKKWNKAKKKSMSHDEKLSYNHHDSNPGLPSSVAKLVQSNYELCEQGLRFVYEKGTYEIREKGNIGRKITNEVSILEDSVSREHAQVVLVDNVYYLRDVGSKFGTFIELGGFAIRPLESGDILAFQDIQIQLIEIVVHPNKTFDLKVKLPKPPAKVPILSFQGKKSVSIGRFNKQISLASAEIAQDHASLAVHENGVYLVKEDGEAFLRLKKDELWALEQKQTVRFGQQPVQVIMFSRHQPVSISSFIQY